MKMKTIAYLLLGFSAFTLVACSLDTPRKSAKLNPCGTRTANGHTWSGRTY